MAEDQQRTPKRRLPVGTHGRAYGYWPYLLVHVDEWTYNLGRNKFRRLLRFENGRLVRIEMRRKPKRSLAPSFDMSRDQ